jgi:tRNA pseudouridine38-40 synthase
MVRILVGTVLDLHDGVLKGTPQTILDALDRSAAGRTMPPGGLCLEKVFY